MKIVSTHLKYIFIVISENFSCGKSLFVCDKFTRLQLSIKQTCGDITIQEKAFPFIGVYAPSGLTSFLIGTLAYHRGYSLLASDLNGFHYPDFKCGGDRKSFNFEWKHFWKILIRAPSIIKKKTFLS